MLTKLRRRLTGEEEEPDQREELPESMRSTQSALSRAYAGFNQAWDQELIESYVYEINALQHRYSYLLRQMRQLESAGAAQ